MDLARVVWRFRWWVLVGLVFGALGSYLQASVAMGIGKVLDGVIQRDE